MGAQEKNPFKHPPPKTKNRGLKKTQILTPLKKTNAGAPFFTGSTTLPLDRFFQVGAIIVTYCNS